MTHDFCDCKMFTMFFW